MRWVASKLWVFRCGVSSRIDSRRFAGMAKAVMLCEIV